MTMRAANRVRGACLAIVLTLLCAAAPVSALAEGKITASQFVKKMSEEAITILTATSSPTEVRESDFRSLLARYFDLDFIGRFALGQSWSSATPELQRE